MLKQKLKKIKTCLKEWHQQHSQNLEGKMTEVKNKISQLDSLGKAYAL